ncbi:hypothetical protein FSP39_000111 [Pinctada imbricata]|uniref:Mab-21-like HhH/H2TH-like domain-containing protein n=1 Tax=Pinctada imbricata TaxID=66713 RepID=A0AA88XSY2_PINIB|nr:hypothetical protein FSP39_000111 [Pinctada imbricata]
MAAASVYDEISLISKGLYRKVSDIVGPECVVKLRRQGWDIRDAFQNCDCYCETTLVSSGSRAEGFEFESSDIDIMYIDRNAIVFTHDIHTTTPMYNIPTILIMDTANVSPGFTFIRCLRYDQNNTTLKRSLVMRGTGIYVSSKQIRESFMSTNMSTCHGPCQTSTLLGNEGDEAYTLRCPVWPKEAMSFVYRSPRQGWPSYDTLTKICKDGCLLVPIYNKQQQYNDMTDLQWRISFSLAEKKLVYSMNHCQFLCYGLSKLFLNEVLKKASPNEDLLCSYYMKTAVFWEVFENHSDWSPLNFLSKFWNVFRRLIKWVSIEYCPNFFIPENNMFKGGKLYGGTQVTLLDTLRDLYMDGYWSLLRCPSLYEDLSQFITQPEIAYTLSCNELEYVPLSTIEMRRLDVVLQFDITINKSDKDNMIQMLINMMLMMNTESAEIMCAVRLRVAHVLQGYAEHLCISKESLCLTRSQNRIKYNDYNMAKSIQHRTKTFFCMNYFILIQYMYMSGNYHRAIEMIHYTRHKLQSQPYMYLWALDVDIIMTALQQGMSYDTVVKSLIVSTVKMDENTSIEELKLELLAYTQTVGGCVLSIPPLVFLDFLLILSYTRNNKNHRRYDILDELHTLLYHDDGHHIKITHKAISWEILGICQQLCGDRHGAYTSYLHALDDEYNYFKHATVERIDSLGI